MLIKKTFLMNINIFHIYPDTQNRDKKIGAVIKITR